MHIFYCTSPLTKMPHKHLELNTAKAKLIIFPLNKLLHTWCLIFISF